MRSLFRKKRKAVVRINNVRYYLLSNGEIVIRTEMTTSQKIAQVLTYLCNAICVAAGIYILWLMALLHQVAYYD